MQNTTTNGNGQRLDLARGMAMMGSEGSLRKILSTVLASLRADLPRIDAALQAGDVPSANRLLHAIKGYMPILGSDALTAQLVTVEQLSKTAAAADLLPAYQQLAPELHGLLTEIHDFLK